MVKYFFHIFSTNYYVLPILLAPMYFFQVIFKYRENLARVASIFSEQSKDSPRNYSTVFSPVSAQIFRFKCGQTSLEEDELFVDGS